MATIKHLRSGTAPSKDSGDSNCPTVNLDWSRLMVSNGGGTDADC